MGEEELFIFMKLYIHIHLFILYIKHINTYACALSDRNVISYRMYPKKICVK